MKSTKEVKGKVSTASSGPTVNKKVTKLVPIKKNGKDSRVVYDEIEDDPALYAYKERDSILDYYDDEED